MLSILCETTADPKIIAAIAAGVVLVMGATVKAGKALQGKMSRNGNGGKPGFAPPCVDHAVLMGKLGVQMENNTAALQALTEKLDRLIEKD